MEAAAVRFQPPRNHRRQRGVPNAKTSSAEHGWGEEGRREAGNDHETTIVLVARPTAPRPNHRRDSRSPDARLARTQGAARAQPFPS